MVLLTGEVSDVTAAVEAGSLYAKDQGLFASSSVMRRPIRICGSICKRGAVSPFIP